MRRFILVGLLAGAACAPKNGAAPTTPAPTASQDIADDAKLTKDQCAEMVDHAFGTYLRTNPSPEDVTRAEQDRDQQKSDESLAQCTQDVNGKFFKCVLASETREEMDKCVP